MNHLSKTDHHLDETTASRKRASNTSEEEKTMCRTLYYVSNWQAPAIAQRLGLTVAQVRYALIARAPPQRRGRPHAVPRCVVDHLFSLINTPRKTKRTMTYKDLQRTHPDLAPYRPEALRLAMIAAGYRRQVQPSSPPMSPKTRQARLAFAFRWAHLLPVDWSHWVWTDETWINGLSSGRRFVTVGPNETAREFARAKFRPNGWMFWGCFAGNQKGPAVIWEKEWGRINSESYQKRILPLLEAFWKDHDSFVIQQDNAPSHNSGSTRTYLRDHFPHAHIADWPSNSPDLNPIEHVWAFMKKWISDQPGERPTGLKLRPAISSAWEAVPADMLTKLYSSMPSRLRRVIEANGGPIGM